MSSKRRRKKPEMRSMEAVLMLVVLASRSSHQGPTFFKSAFKGLSANSARPISQSGGEIKAVYFHDQTVAVVDLGPKNELHNCDLIEVYEPSQASEVLRNLTIMVRPQHVSFQDMTKLMQKCELLDRLQMENVPLMSTSALSKTNRVGVSSLTLLSGILPGTKWCGTGDIAENYHDLGQDAQIDRCCRSHDLCPVKVRAQQTRYNLTNYSLYTKSHCSCDETLYYCLKASNHPTANIMGHIYFNIVKVPCIEDVSKSHSSIRQFIPVKMSY